MHNLFKTRSDGVSFTGVFLGIVMQFLDSPKKSKTAYTKVCSLSFHEFRTSMCVSLESNLALRMNGFISIFILIFFFFAHAQHRRKVAFKTRSVNRFSL